LSLCFTQGSPLFTKDTVSKAEISVCTNLTGTYETLEETDSQIPLVVKYNVEKGNVILFNTSAYPGNPAIKGLYEKKML